MPEVFADTGYWIALLDERDSLHDRARGLSEQFSTYTIVTTEMVLTELLNHYSRGGSQMRLQIAEAVSSWTASSSIEAIPLTSHQFHSALERYRARPDHAWSLVDCASFILMEERGIQEALAFDRHFEQAGFTTLLRSSD